MVIYGLDESFFLTHRSSTRVEGWASTSSELPGGSSCADAWHAWHVWVLEEKASEVLFLGGFDCFDACALVFGEISRCFFTLFLGQPL